MSLRLAAQESTLGERTLVEKFEFALELGFDGIELGAHGDGVFAARRSELKAAKDAGVIMPTAVVAMKHFVGAFDDGDRVHALADVKDILTTLGSIEADGLVMPNGFAVFSRSLPPFTPPRSDEESRASLVAALRELGAHAHSVGTTVFLEPLNRYEDYLVNTLADAVSVVEEVGSPGVAVIADTYHMSIEEISIGDALRAAGPHVKHVQLGDSGRLEPGVGHYDWTETLDALDDIGYEGWLAMECRLSGPTEAVLPSVAKLLKR